MSWERSPKIVFSSSIQAELDNPYGVSKAKAEDALRQFSSRNRSLRSDIPSEEPIRKVVSPQLQLSHSYISATTLRTICP